MQSELSREMENRKQKVNFQGRGNAVGKLSQAGTQW